MVKYKGKTKKIIYILLLIIVLISLSINGLFLARVLNEKTLAKENIVFFGDSITEQYNIKKFYTKRHIINKGIGGNTTEDLIERLDNDLIDYNPTKVIILIGINDIRQGVDENNIFLNVQSLFNEIKENRPNTKIYLQSIYPVNEEILKDHKNDLTKKLKNEDIKSINKGLKKICSENKIKYINVYDEILDEKGNLNEIYTTDGLHLSNLGYLKISSILKKYI